MQHMFLNIYIYIYTYIHIYIYICAQTTHGFIYFLMFLNLFIVRSVRVHRACNTHMYK